MRKIILILGLLICLTLINGCHLEKKAADKNYYYCDIVSIRPCDNCVESNIYHITFIHSKTNRLMDTDIHISDIKIIEGDSFLQLKGTWVGVGRDLKVHLSQEDLKKYLEGE